MKSAITNALKWQEGSSFSDGNIVIGIGDDGLVAFGNTLHNQNQITHLSYEDAKHVKTANWICPKCGFETRGYGVGNHRDSTACIARFSGIPYRLLLKSKAAGKTRKAALEHVKMREQEDRVRNAHLKAKAEELASAPEIIRSRGIRTMLEMRQTFRHLSNGERKELLRQSR